MKVILYDFSCQYINALLTSLDLLRNSENICSTGFSYTKDEASLPETIRLSSFSSLLSVPKNSLFSESHIVNLSLALNIPFSQYQGKLILQELLDEALLKTFSDLHYRHFNFNINKFFSYLYTLCSFLDHFVSQSSLVIHRDTIQNAPGLMLYILSQKYGCKFLDFPNTAYINKGYLRVNLNPLKHSALKCSSHITFDSDDVYSRILNLSPPGLFKRSNTKLFGLTLVKLDSFSISLYRFAIVVNIAKYSCLHSFHYLIILARLTKTAFSEIQSLLRFRLSHKLKTYLCDAIFHHQKLLSYSFYQSLCFLDADKLLDLYKSSCFNLILLNLQPERTTSPNTLWFNDVNLFFESIASSNPRIGDTLPYVIREHPANYMLNSHHIIRSYLYRSPTFYIRLHRNGAIFSDPSLPLSHLSLLSRNIIIWSSSFALEYQCLVDQNPIKPLPKMFEICNEWYSDIVDTTPIFTKHSTNLCASPLKVDRCYLSRSSLQESLNYLSKTYIWIDVIPETIDNHAHDSTLALSKVIHSILDGEF